MHNIISDCPLRRYATPGDADRKHARPFRTLYNFELNTALMRFSTASMYSVVVT